MKEQTNTLFKVPNNEEGQLFLALAKKYLNKESYLLRQRGRTPNHKKLKKDKERARQDFTPLKYADNLGIYLMAKSHYGGRMRTMTLGIETIKLADYYRKLYYENCKYHELPTKINSDVIPFFQATVSRLIHLTNYKED